MSRALIDTHAFIWWTGEPKRLSELVHNFLIDPENKPVLSCASVWAMQIKLSLGKLTLKTLLPELIEDEVKRNGLSLMPIELNHIYALSDLPPYHRDPFDRLLIAQATIEEIPIISIDEKFDVYGVQRLW